MSGVGDERTRSLYTRAVAFVGSVMAFVLPGWWLVTVAQGDPDRTLTILCAIFGFTFIAAVAVLARRSRNCSTDTSQPTIPRRRVRLP